jgi:GTP cyclohydrolase I
MVPRPSGPGAPKLVPAPVPAAAPGGGVAGALASGVPTNPGASVAPIASGAAPSGGTPGPVTPGASTPGGTTTGGTTTGGTTTGGTTPVGPTTGDTTSGGGTNPDTADQPADDPADRPPDPGPDAAADGPAHAATDTTAHAGSHPGTDTRPDGDARGVPGRPAGPSADLPLTDAGHSRNPTQSRTAYHPSTMASTDLPPNVRRLVDEIESEIGETSVAIDDITGARGREHEGEEGTDNGRVEAAVRRILEEIGEDPDRQGLVGTPGRVHRMYTELTAGYHVDPERLINNAIFDVDYSEMVIVKDIPFYSLCEHHLLPFFGTASVAYIPRGRVIGLSKIPRIVEMYARRLQVQERLTQQIAEFLQDRLAPQGVGVVIEATHLCAVMRGVRKPGTIMTTSSVLGLFRTRDRTRAEFLDHLARTPAVHG